MINEEKQAQIRASFLDTIERMAFMFGEAADSPEIPPESDILHCAMTFKGQRNGGVAIAMPAELCAELASNLLGADPGEVEDPAQNEDALKELLNVVCGQLLTALEGDVADFRLSIPAIVEADDETVAAYDAFDFQVDGHPIKLSVSFEETE